MNSRAHIALSVCLVAVAATWTRPPLASAAIPPAPAAPFEMVATNASFAWSGAEACDVSAAGVACYPSEADMDAALAARRQQAPTTSTTSCSASVRLYDGTSFTGSVLNLSTRGVVISLGTYGFDNMTSSYAVGPCAAKFYSGFGTGLYPGATGAFNAATAMVSGWNNVISSVLIP
jgi:hypothetical protein